MADAGAKVLRGLLDVFVLESLERAPKHGYAILREMAEAFGTTPNRNRLYPLLGRMVRDGLVAERSEPNGTRTLYALTELGHDALAGYRKMPPAFLQRLARVWSTPTAPAPPASVRDDARPAPAPAAPRAIPVVDATPTLVPEGAPYPCVDARLSLEKDPRTGDLAVQLTGCPMGAYDYCPQCPVYKGVEGLRRLTFS